MNITMILERKNILVFEDRLILLNKDFKAYEINIEKGIKGR
jgi:hypothetical protein